MNKEDIDKILDDYLSDYHKKVVKDYIKEIEQRNVKAIEYIEETLISMWVDERECLKRALKILKGSDKE